jgi:hypothetical protein
MSPRRPGPAGSDSLVQQGNALPRLTRRLKKCRSIRWCLRPSTVPAYYLNAKAPSVPEKSGRYQVISGERSALPAAPAETCLSPSAKRRAREPRGLGGLGARARCGPSRGSRALPRFFTGPKLFRTNKLHGSRALCLRELSAKPCHKQEGFYRRGRGGRGGRRGRNGGPLRCDYRSVRIRSPP